MDNFAFFPWNGGSSKSLLVLRAVVGVLRENHPNCGVTGIVSR